MTFNIRAAPTKKQERAKLRHRTMSKIFGFMT